MRYRCCTCGSTFQSGEVEYLCPRCTGKPGGFMKGVLLIEIDIEELKQRFSPGHWPDNLDLMPLEAHRSFRSFPAGHTPLIQPTGLQKSRGFPQLYCKLEGSNPSGSLKDRASLLVAAQASSAGEDRVVLASTGNAGSSMSCAGAALGLKVNLFVPASAPVEKLLQSLYYGARVVPLEGTYDDAFRLSLEYSRKYGGINRNTAYNPLTIEGKKSAAVEICRQLDRVPEVVYIPTGDGVIYTALCKGFEELFQLGLIDRIPRCVAVQAEGSNALHRSFREKRQVILERTETLADSIAVCSPACGEAALHYLEKTEGWTTEVSDREIEEARSDLAAHAGIFAEPSSASVWAALQQDREAGRISGNETIVLLITGTGFKDMEPLKKQVEVPPAAQCSIDGVLEWMDRWKQ